MQPVVLDVAGTPVSAMCGETVAAALTRAGIRALRRGPDRGVFCGMGVCQDCVVAIDGVPARACMTAVTGPHRIGMACPMPPPAPLPPIELADIPVLTPDVLVVGGGAAGLSAAAAAAEAGASVVLLDERSRPGGQYFKQPAPGLKAGDDRRFAAGRRLLARAQEAGAQLLSEATVWAAVPPRDIAVLSPSGLAIYRPTALVVATGAYERARPVPGWTLPGVMTTGAAQTLLRGEGVAPGRRVLVCGHGPLNLQVAVELARSGAEVVAVAEQAARPGLRHAGALWRMAASAPALLAQGAALRRDLHRRRVKVLHGHVLAAVRAVPGGLQAELSGLPAAFDVDVVCMGYGFQPANEILLALDCRHRFDPVRSQLVTERDGDGGTSVAGVYAAGDCCGLGGAHAAVADGRIAGAAAARHVGRAAPPDAAERRRLARHRRFQDGLWRLYAAPDMATALATPDTIVCRCEGVTMGAIQAAIDAGAPGIGAVKRLTRAGMGACQGRYCAPVLAALLARRSGAPIDPLSFLAPRAPIKPVPIAALSRP